MEDEPSCDTIEDLRPDTCRQIDELLGDTTLEFRFDVLMMCIYAGLATAPDDQRARYQNFVRGFLSLPAEVHRATPDHMQQLICEATDPATQVALRGRELMGLLVGHFNSHVASACPIGMLAELCVHIPPRDRAEFRKLAKRRLDRTFRDLERRFPDGPPTSQDERDSIQMRGQLIETLRSNRKAAS
jgi:hypothetical protein